MLNIHFDPELEITLSETTKHKTALSDELVKGFFDLLPKIPCFENKDPLLLQKELRNEWN
ncbi:MAG: hypothetical protein RIS84_585 [Pseudomonadota bacterium]|jgi:hypothetical protein